MTEQQMEQAVERKLAAAAQQLEELELYMEVAFGLLLLRRHRLTDEEIEAEERHLSACQERYFAYRQRWEEAMAWASG